jgi:hypothetical protein
VLAGSDKLLGHEIAEPAGGLDSPLPFAVEPVDPDTEPIGLTDRGTVLTSSSTRSSPSIATAVWLVLWGSIPIITVMVLPSLVDGEPRWALLIRVDVLAPLSSHTTVRDTGHGKHFDTKPTRGAAGT